MSRGPGRTCVVHTFEHTSGDGAVPPLVSFLARCFGPDLVSGGTWG